MDQKDEFQYAREEYDLCCFWESTLTLDLESVYMTNNTESKMRLNRQLDVCRRLKKLAWDRLESLRRQTVPSFEALLADPTLQFDKDGEIVKSILEYIRLGSVSMCMKEITVKSATASVESVKPPSVYVCTNAKPCPDHDADKRV